jgi:hemerythrin superfamily protein
MLRLIEHHEDEEYGSYPKPESAYWEDVRKALDTLIEGLTYLERFSGPC